MKGTLTRTALAAGGMMVTSAVMAGSLALPTAQSLAGQWQVADSERQCQIEFLANEQSETNGYCKACLRPRWWAGARRRTASPCCGRMAARWRSSRATAICIAISWAPMMP